jgi:hypothetical protein
VDKLYLSWYYISDMQVTSEHFHTVPTTARRANFVVSRHGFENIASLAGSLPLEAVAIDVGAGVSPLGNEVATLRPDIQWINFDFSYIDPAILAEAAMDAPKNVEFVQGDASRLSEEYPPGTFDALFSYWLMPHLSLYTTETAKKTAAGMFDVAKYGGYLSIGPITGGFVAQRRGYHLIKTEDVSREEFAQEVADKTRLRGARLIKQRVNNEAVTAALGTTRHMKRSPKLGIKQFPVRGSDNYHSMLNPLTLPTAAKMGAYMIREYLRPSTYTRVVD